MIPTDPEAREGLAAEFVLGTLEAFEAAAVAAALPTDAALREAVAAWEARLAPLQGLAPPEAPPPELWARIEATLKPATPAAPVARKPAQAEPMPVAPTMAPTAAEDSDGPGIWRLWALASTALAAALAAVLALR